MRSPILLALLLAPLAESFAQQKEGFPPDDPDSWRVAGTAKVFCSALFVSGRDSAEVRNHLSAYFLGARVDSITSIQVDRQRKLVRLTLANRITREAKQYGDQGCVIHQPGKDTVFFRPVRVTTALPDASTMPWPMGDVLSDLPLPAEIDTAKLRQAVDAAFATPAGLTAAFVVVHKGRIVAERYANGAHKEMQLESWSMGKSITGTLIGLLIQQGALRLEDPALVPEWRKTPNDPRARIRVMDLMRMSSGLRFSRGSPEDIPGYHDHDLIYTGAIDAFQFVTTRPLQFEPNTFGRYRNTDPLTLGMLIRDAVRKRGEEYLTWPQRALFDKIGIRRQVLETDPYGNFLLSGYDYGTGRNWARLGLLYVNDGVWLGERLLPEGFVKFVSTPAPAWRDTSYGGMVWVNGRGTWNLPRDAFAFRGAGGQETYVVPSRDLVIVRMGHFPGARAGSADFQRAHVLLMEAIPPSSASNLAITNVAVVDGTNSVARAGQTVVIRGNRIVAVTPSASARVPAGARVVDGRGKFLIPGLWDMHVHTAIIGGRDILALYVANGVTGVRDMAGDWETIGAWRRDIAAGRLVGPRIVASGPYLEGGDVPIPHILVRNADEARAGVDSLVSLGVPFIKVHTQLRPETYFAIARRARERGIAFAGHVPNSVGARAASDSGQRSIEHMLAIPAPCTPAESLALRPRFPVQAALGRCSSRDLAPLYEAFVRNRTWVTPTFAAAYEIASWPKRALPGDSLAHYLPDTLRRFVLGIFPMPDSIPPGADSVGHAMLAKRMAQVVTMHRAGVGILTGTDAPLRNSPPGFGLHEELMMLARAGLSPFEIIRAATLEPARYFEMTDSAGTVAPGMLADLVLLDANPLADIRNARRIAAVILNGRLVDAAERRRLLNSAAERRP